MSQVKQEVAEMIRSLGLTVTPKGYVYTPDKGYKFGHLTQDDFICAINGNFCTLYDVQRVVYDEDGNTLQIIYNDDTLRMVTGVPEKKSSESDEGDGDVVLKKIPSSISELNAVFPELYPDAGNQLYYDELQEREMVDMAMFGRPTEGLKALNDTIVAIYYEDLEIKLKEHDYKIGKLPSFAVRDNVLTIQIHSHTRNLFREWVESHEWDGKPRLRTWFRDTFGATAPPLEESGEDEVYLGDVAEAWFVGGIKRMYSETKHEIVPVFIGDQGIGKGLALRYTAGRDGWYVDTSANVKEPERFLDGVRGNIIVELSESTQLRNADNEALKAFISKSSDQIRKAYARHNERYPRHFILAASSNLDNVFTDITGNRRFFPMYCDPTKATRKFSQDRSVGQYDVEQVWAEALYLYRNGGKWYMTEEAAARAKVMQDFGTQENTNISTIDDWLDDPMGEYSEVGSRVSKAIIMDRVFHCDPTQLIPQHIENAFRAWANSQRSWTKMNKTARVGGKVCRAYERKYAPGDVHITARLGIVDSAPAAKTVDDIMRERADKYGFKDVGDDFPIDGLTEHDLDDMMNEGYIYQYTVDPPVYKLGYLP